MLKYLFTACVVFSLLLHAQNEPTPSNKEEAFINDEMFDNDECDDIYDECIVKCDDTNSENDKCYSTCEELFEECLLKKEKDE